MVTGTDITPPVQAVETVSVTVRSFTVAVTPVIVVMSPIVTSGVVNASLPLYTCAVVVSVVAINTFPCALPVSVNDSAVRLTE